MADFPPAGMINKEDAKTFEIEFENLAKDSKTDGGYRYTRARGTGKPKKKIRIAFTAVEEPDKLLIEDFYNEHFGGNTVFTYQSHESGGPVYLVRFANAVSFRYSGVGVTSLWDVSCQFEVIEVITEPPLPVFIGYGDSYGDMYGGGVMT